MNTKRKKNKRYFTEETQKYIVEYNSTEDTKIRGDIYAKHIKYPFEKLFENIYNTYKQLFAYVNDDYFMLRSECMVFLTDKMDTYSEDIGRAYSYFGTILKRYLIQKNQSEEIKQKRRVDVEYIDDNVIYDYLANETLEYVSEFIDVYVDYIDSNIHYIFTDKVERKIADAIIDMFRKREELYLGDKGGDKKILYILIRERANLTKQQTLKITQVVKKFKSIYDKLYYNYDAYGCLSVSGSYY